MAAETTLMAMFPAGSHIIAGHDIYGGTYRLFSQVCATHGLEFSFVDMVSSPANVKKAMRKNTKAVWIETPSNPLLNLVNVTAVCDIAREAGAMSIVDNTFMSPFFQQPLDLGADVALHSTTKYINGHSDVVSGAIVTATAELGEKVAWMMNNLGTGCSPFDAWLVLRGVKTLPLRMKAHEANALALAHYLDERPEVSHVYYPGLKTHPHHALAKKQMSGFGGMLSFDLKGGQAAAFKFVQALKVISFAESLGGVESLIEHPETMSHASMTLEQRRKAGIGAGNLRVSVGIEDAGDLIEDLDRGFAALKRRKK
jgi:cystathionine beta-lyase/cystathionine gamma-synthase